VKVITIDSLWAWAIIHGPKRVENRSWTTKHRGPLLIHAGLNTSREGEVRKFLSEQGLSVPEGDELDCLRGKIIGCVNLVDIVSLEQCNFTELSLTTAPYAFGPECWILENPQVLSPLPAKGRLGIWEFKTSSV